MYINQILRQARQTDPGCPAFVSADGHTVSYPQFADRACRVAAALRELAPDDGARIGILALNSPAYVEVYLGAMWSGRVAVPLNVRWSLKELAYAMEDAQVDVLCVDAAFAPLAAQLATQGVACRQIVYMSDGPAPDGLMPYAQLLSRAPAEEAPTTPETLACVVYTGGTTGFPKGAMHTQASMLASSLNSVCLGYPPAGSRYLLAVPLFHLAGFGLGFAQLLQGGTLVVMPAFKPELVVRAVTEFGADALGLVPTMIGMLLDAPEFRASDFAKLRLIGYGASPMPSALLRRVMETLPNVKLTQAYGMTEVGAATMLRDYWHRGPQAQPSAAGQAGPFYQVKIVDEQGRELPRGQLGEVMFFGPGVMAGYLNKPEATAEALAGGGMHSGDAGVMDDHGVVTLLDRVKDMIVTGAENVYSVEVENAVTKHPAVAQCAVVGIPDDKFGEAVHAVVVLKPGMSLSIEQLRAHCMELIAGYKCPRTLEVRDSMPLSAMGKILKADLRAPHWAGRAKKVN